MTDASHTTARCLLCRIGSALCALPLEHVVETMRPLPVERIRGMPAFVRGLSIIRGAPLPVVDLAALLGTGDGASATRFVTVRLGERRAALAVDGVVDVRALPAPALGELPPLVREVDPDVVSAIGALDSELLLILESTRLVPDSLWAAVEAARETHDVRH